MAYLLPIEDSYLMHPQKQVDLSANDSFYATENSAYPWYAPAGVQRGLVQAQDDLAYFQDKLMTSLAVPEEYSVELNNHEMLQAMTWTPLSNWEASPDVYALKVENQELKEKLAQAEASYYCSQAEVARLHADMDMWAEEVRPAVDAYWASATVTVDILVEPNPAVAYERAMKVL